MVMVAITGILFASPVMRAHLLSLLSAEVVKLLLISSGTYGKVYSASYMKPEISSSI
jgi:hypothetical protein